MIEVKVYNIKVEDINKSDSNTKDTYPMVEYQFYGFLMDEIQLVNEQNASLKAEVERLTEANDCLDKMHEKEMARSAYLCEEVNRTTAWGRGLESDLSHARVEISFLKAEVERLTRKLEVADNHAQCLEMVINAGTANELRLKAEVERLRKAGDEVIHEWSSGDEKEARNFMKALVIWNAAKEGKPSV